MLYCALRDSQEEFTHETDSQREKERERDRASAAVFNSIGSTSSGG